MSRELICSWLGLPPELWPPDHYRLLGLEPGEGNVEHIEEQVQTRLELVRRYQLTHPEQVTEAMNRLAQAFVCLTDPASKRAYDADLLGKPAAGPAEEAPAAADEQPLDTLTWLVGAMPRRGAEESRAAFAELDWSAAPPPQRSVALMDIPAIRLPAAAPAPQEKPAAEPSDGATAEAKPPDGREDRPQAILPVEIPDVPPPPAPPPPPPRPDPITEAARSSVAARRGLGTKRGLYQRVARTRKLLHAWEQAGKYLGNPKRRLAKPAEATELIRLLAAIRTLLQGFPPLIGEGDQPGYAVVALSRQHTPVPMFQTLLPSQRETLALHWKNGRELLAAHRDYLRQEARGLRKKSLAGRALRAVRAALTDQPLALLLFLALLALNVVIWRLNMP